MLSKFGSNEDQLKSLQDDRGRRFKTVKYEVHGCSYLPHRVSVCLDGEEWLLSFLSVPYVDLLVVLRESRKKSTFALTLTNHTHTR